MLRAVRSPDFSGNDELGEFGAWILGFWHLRFEIWDLVLGACSLWPETCDLKKLASCI